MRIPDVKRVHCESFTIALTVNIAAFYSKNNFEDKFFKVTKIRNIVF